jgi:hypothetical protein
MADATLDYVLRSSFIFSGTVIAETASSLKALTPRPGLSVLRLERGFLVNPMLGDLGGRRITVRTAPNVAGSTIPLRSGERLLIFATAWVHGEEIAVNEIGRLAADVKTEQEVGTIVASLPERHLSERIASAAVIVHGTVVRISPAPDVPGIPSEHQPEWMRAFIEPKEFLKGEAPAGQPNAEGNTVVLLFPGSHDRAFLNVPRPTPKQPAVFLLHRGSGLLPQNALVAPDPADIQPEQQLPLIRRLLGGTNPR